MVWGSFDNWRNHPIFKPQFNNVFPGLKLAGAVLATGWVLSKLTAGPGPKYQHFTIFT